MLGFTMRPLVDRTGGWAKWICRQLWPWGRRSPTNWASTPITIGAWPVDMPALLARLLHAGSHQVPMETLLTGILVPDRLSGQRAREWLGTGVPSTLVFGRPGLRSHNRRRSGGPEG